MPSAPSPVPWGARRSRRLRASPASRWDRIRSSPARPTRSPDSGPKWSQYVHEPARDELIDWLGREGAEALEAATATMVHLDVLLRAAALERPTVGPLLGPYVARAEAARNSLGEALGRVGVLVP
jgi:hypothetical protein